MLLFSHGHLIWESDRNIVFKLSATLFLLLQLFLYFTLAITPAIFLTVSGAAVKKGGGVTMSIDVV